MRFHTPIWQSPPHELVPISYSVCFACDGCLKTTICMPLALISNSMGDLAVPYSITTFDTSSALHKTWLAFNILWRLQQRHPHQSSSMQLLAAWPSDDSATEHAHDANMCGLREWYALKLKMFFCDFTVVYCMVCCLILKALIHNSGEVEDFLDGCTVDDCSRYPFFNEGAKIAQALRLEGV